uniref:Uncharacterized protein n=1 Tax=Rhizophora mucronata TaxID=61149 RepID=A0A2P2PSX2_RHIMU
MSWTTTYLRERKNEVRKQF